MKSEQEQPLSTRFAFPGVAGEVLRAHFERDAREARLSTKFKLYYRFRPWIPIPVRQLLQRGRNRGMEVAQDWFLPRDFVADFQSAVAQDPDRLVVHPWPDGFELAIVLTHDVETREGLQKVDQLAAIEESYGLRSAWNVIPYKYQVDQKLLTDLKQRGHEVAVHGYNHDGRLFESRRTFRHRCRPINEALTQYGSSGFRAPMVHRNLTWLQALEIDYDASCFDVDPFQAMPGGVGGVWPFLAGKFVELPYTLPQDHTLLVSLGETTPRVWIEKLAYLRQLAGMALLITHPDYLDTPSRLDVYRAFLEHVVAQRDAWHALPSQVANWWRQRDALKVVEQGASRAPVGPLAERARLVPLGNWGRSQSHARATSAVGCAASTDGV